MPKGALFLWGLWGGWGGGQDQKRDRFLLKPIHFQRGKGDDDDKDNKRDKSQRL